MGHKHYNKNQLILSIVYTRKPSVVVVLIVGYTISLSPIKLWVRIPLMARCT